MPSETLCGVWCYKRSSESNAITSLSTENIDGIVTRGVSACRMEATTYIDCFPPPGVQQSTVKCALWGHWDGVWCCPPKLGIKRDHFTLKWPCLCNSNRKNILLYLEAASMAWLFSTTWSAEMAKNEKGDVLDVWYWIFMGSSPIALLSSGHICPIAILMGFPPSPTAYVQ